MDFEDEFGVGWGVLFEGIHHLLDELLDGLEVRAHGNLGIAMHLQRHGVVISRHSACEQGVKLPVSMALDEPPEVDDPMFEMTPELHLPLVHEVGE